jgi:uncharacterized protein (TIGR00369 family)
MITMIDDASPDVVAHVLPIFEDAAFVRDLGITLVDAGPGWCETALHARDTHLQQHGFLHAGVVTTLADHTAGGAARAAVPPGSDVLTIEFKMNFLRPARTRHLACVGRTLRAGKSVVVAESEVFSVDGSERTLVAKCISSLSVIPQRERIARS